MKVLYMFLVIVSLVVFSTFQGTAQHELFNNGGFVTHPGAGPGGSDVSLLVNPLVNYGFGNQSSMDRITSEDFTVSGQGWIIDSVVFFQYQTGSSQTSSFTATFLQISNSTQVIWGDLTTNRLSRSAWTRCYRNDDYLNTDRPVMRNTCTTPSLTLPAGNYFIDWQASGSLTSGPWCVPVTVNGQPATGNAMVYSDGEWNYIYGDTLNMYQQGLPFIIYGRPIGSPGTITIKESYSFSDPYSLASYRIIGFPGLTNFPVSSIMTGTPGTNWTAFRDNGQTSNYMIAYDGTTDFTFKPGNAFWITSENTIFVNKTVSAVTASTSKTYPVTLNPGGWTLISNPFDSEVDWDDIRSVNGLAGNHKIWEWEGYWENSDKLKPGRGYYFLAPSGISVLNIPDPGANSAMVTSKSTREDEDTEVIFTLMSGVQPRGSVRIGFTENGDEGWDSSDIPMPTGHFETSGMRLLIPNGSLQTREGWLDSRQTVGNGQTYQLLVKNLTGNDLTLNAAIRGLPAETEIRMLDHLSLQHIDLKQNPQCLIGSGTDIRTILIGPAGYIREGIKKFNAGHLIGLNCLPNPVKTTARLLFSITTRGLISISFFDLTGRQVVQFPEVLLEDGFHHLPFDGSLLGSGVYICRLSYTPENQPAQPARVLRIMVDH